MSYRSAPPRTTAIRGHHRPLGPTQLHQFYDFLFVCQRRVGVELFRRPGGNRNEISKVTGKLNDANKEGKDSNDFACFSCRIHVRKRNRVSCQNYSLPGLIVWHGRAIEIHCSRKICGTWIRKTRPKRWCHCSQNTGKNQWQRRQALNRK